MTFSFTARGSFGWRGVVLGALVALGCATKSSLDEGRACHADADCPTNQSCHLGQTPGETPQVVFNPCASLVGCADSSTCASGQVCGPYTGTTVPGISPACPASVCQAPCQQGGCLADQVCGSDGVCKFESCDQSGAPACSAHYRCDPAAAATVDVTQPLNGSSLGDPANVTREQARGCVRAKCDETDGFVCRALWSCDPPNAGNEASGCTPDPCAQSGHCSDDGYYICQPDGADPRPPGMDVNGCVVRNCAEGYACVYEPDGATNYASCELGADGADVYGCVIHQCDEQPSCPTQYVCDPTSPKKDVRGCRLLQCNETGGMACPDSYLCDPTSSSGTIYGCVYQPPSSGGTGGGGAGGSSGASGSSGTGGAATGGSAAVGGSSGSAGTSGAGGTAAGGSGGGAGLKGSGGSSTGGSSTGGSSGSSAGGTMSGTTTGMCVAAE